MASASPVKQYRTSSKRADSHEHKSAMHHRPQQRDRVVDHLKPNLAKPHSQYEMPRPVRSSSNIPWLNEPKYRVPEFNAAVLQMERKMGLRGCENCEIAHGVMMRARRKLKRSREKVHRLRQERNNLLTENIQLRTVLGMYNLPLPRSKRAQPSQRSRSRGRKNKKRLRKSARPDRRDAQHKRPSRRDQRDAHGSRAHKSAHQLLTETDQEPIGRLVPLSAMKSPYMTLKPNEGEPPEFYSESEDSDVSNSSRGLSEALFGYEGAETAYNAVDRSKMTSGRSTLGMHDGKLKRRNSHSSVHRSVKEANDDQEYNCHTNFRGPRGLHSFALPPPPHKH